MTDPKTVTINGYELVLTCDVCPEQYDVYRNGHKVGYLRLRHGRFRADVPGVGGLTVYSANTNGDGDFDPDERMTHLTNAVNAIAKHYDSPFWEYVFSFKTG